jgi:hypothetical protein
VYYIQTTNRKSQSYVDYVYYIQKTTRNDYMYYI